MTYTVKASGLSKSFGGRLVLDRVDLAIPPGTIYALLGPNGAGKTTLVKILATLVRPDAGTATVDGHDLLADPAAVKRSISLTGQHSAVDEVLTGAENLQMMARLLHLPRRAATARAAQLLADFGLSGAADQRAGRYSGGMRRRLDLAMALTGQPRLLFLDEPSTGLDPRSRDQLWTTIRGLPARGVTILMTTQYLAEADLLADRIGLLDHGALIAEGTADELKSRLGGEFVRLQFASLAACQRAAGLLDPVTADERLKTIEIATDGTAGQVRRALGLLESAGAPAQKVSVRRPSLDDVFLALTGPRPAAAASDSHDSARKVLR